MATRQTNDWLQTEKIPQVSNSLKRRLNAASVSGGLTKGIIAETDDVIRRATRAIRKHYDDEQAARVRESFRREVAQEEWKE